MSLNQRVTAEFSTCTSSAPHARDLSIQTYRPNDEGPRRATGMIRVTRRLQDVEIHSCTKTCPGVQLASIIPWARKTQDCGTLIRTCTAGDRVGPGDLKTIRVPGPQNVTAGRKCSRLDCPRTEAWRIES